MGRKVDAFISLFSVPAHILKMQITPFLCVYARRRRCWKFVEHFELHFRTIDFKVGFFIDFNNKKIIEKLSHVHLKKLPKNRVKYNSGVGFWRQRHCKNMSLKENIWRYCVDSRHFSTPSLDLALSHSIIQLYKCAVAPK